MSAASSLFGHQPKYHLLRKAFHDCFILGSDAPPPSCPLLLYLLGGMHTVLCCSMSPQWGPCCPCCSERSWQSAAVSLWKSCCRAESKAMHLVGWPTSSAVYKGLATSAQLRTTMKGRPTPAFLVGLAEAVVGPALQCDLPLPTSDSFPSRPQMLVPRTLLSKHSACHILSQCRFLYTREALFPL